MNHDIIGRVVTAVAGIAIPAFMVSGWLGAADARYKENVAAKLATPSAVPVAAMAELTA